MFLHCRIHTKHHKWHWPDWRNQQLQTMYTTHVIYIFTHKLTTSYIRNTKLHIVRIMHIIVIIYQQPNNLTLVFTKTVIVFQCHLVPTTTILNDGRHEFRTVPTRTDTAHLHSNYWKSLMVHCKARVVVYLSGQNIGLWPADFPCPVPDLRLTGDHFVELSAMGQPTRLTQLSIPLWFVNEW